MHIFIPKGIEIIAGVGEGAEHLSATPGKSSNKNPTLKGSHGVTRCDPFRVGFILLDLPGVALAFGSLTPGYCLHPLRGCWL